MPDGLLTFEHGEVRLGIDTLPGLLQSQNVSGKVRFDEAEQDGMSGTVKVPMGWDDSDITLVVELLTEPVSTCYDKLAQLNRIFKGTDNGGNPNVYDVVNAHLVARGIERVVFSGLSSQETDQDDVIMASLAFTEHIPPVTIIEQRATASQDSSVPATTATEPVLNDNMMVDLE